MCVSVSPICAGLRVKCGMNHVSRPDRGLPSLGGPKVYGPLCIDDDSESLVLPLLMDMSTGKAIMRLDRQLKGVGIEKRKQARRARWYARFGQRK